MEFVLDYNYGFVSRLCTKVMVLEFIQKFKTCPVYHL